jgi:septal ring factor EnvC (AmiA/AmiB activator)
MNPPRRSSSPAIAALALLLAACGGGPDQAAKDAASAASAAELIAAQRLSGAIPSTYAAKLLHDLGSGLDQSEQQLTSGRADAKRAKDATEQLGRVLGEMSSDVRSDDRAALRRSTAAAHALGRTLSDASARLQQSGGGGG